MMLGAVHRQGRVTKATALRSNTGGILLAFQGQGPSQLSEDRDPVQIFFLITGTNIPFPK